MSKKIFTAVFAVALIAVGVVTFQPQLILAGVVMGAGVAFAPKTPKATQASRDRLFATLDPIAPRKTVFGRTAMATDVRYQAFTGTDQEYYHQIMCIASHEAEAIEELWFDSEMAWSVGGGVVAKYSDYLTVTPRPVGTSGNGIAIDSTWTTASTLTGCAYLYLRYKLTGNDKKAESPFAQSVPNRVTVRGKGAKLPDIREGGCLATDQTTWDWFDDDSGRNPALQLLFYLIGWRINGKLAVGRGIPAARIDLDSFITAANLCDEPVTLAVGGTEPRYRADGIFSESDDPGTVLANFTAAMNAVLRDNGGQISLHVLHNDLASPVAAFDENDILGDETWKQTPPLDESFNVVRGRWTDPSDEALYQLADYPAVEIASVDDIERIETFDLQMVQSAPQAQRLAKQHLQRSLYPGTYSAQFGARAWQVNLGDVVTFSHIALGWDEKLSRVVGHGVTKNGVTPMTLREEHANIYAWDAEESPAVVAAVPTAYDALNSPLIVAIGDAEDELDILIAGAAAAADDNVLTIDEKIRVLPQALAELAARYDQVTARADELGIDTSPATDAKDAFLDYLDGLTPSYKDTSQDTSLGGTNLLVDGTFPTGTGWANDLTSLSPTDEYHATEDGSAASFLNIAKSIASTGLSTYTVAWIVRMDAVGGATRTPAMRIRDAAGTQNISDLVFDTSTGAVVHLWDPTTSLPNPFATGTVARLADDEWLAWQSLALNADNISLTTSLFPAVGTAAGGYDAATTGSAVVRDPVLVLGGFEDLGRLAYNVLLRAYAASLDALDRAISEADAQRALTISGPASSSVTAKTDGTFESGVLPKVVQLKLGDGGGGNMTLDATWNVTVKSGSATATDPMATTGSGATAAANLSVSALGATTVFEITATVNGVVVGRFTHTMEKIIPATGSGGGGTGGTTGSQPITGTNATTSHASITVAIRAKAGSGGQVDCYAPVSFLCTDNLTDTSISAYFKWRWRVIGGAYADIAAEEAATTAASVLDEGGGIYDRQPGSHNCNKTKTGLTDGVEYEFELQARVAESSRTLVFSGQDGASAQCVGS